MIDHEKRLLFIHIARTGGTSVETALIQNDWWFIEPNTKHLSASQAHKYYGEEIWNSYTKFAVVRNPWDRIISMWATGWWRSKSEDVNSNINDKKKLTNFILQLKPHPHEIYDSLFYHEILDERMDYILRFENLALDLSAMLAELKLQQVSLPHVEKGERKHYREYYDKDTEKLVGSIFQKDIELFHYKF